MDDDSFLTISQPSTGSLREKMSKFLAFAHPAATAADAKEIIARYQKEYHDARHVCWAYMVGADRKEFLSSDNGEPSGTAGKPILGQINSFGLTDVVIVVVRYFGGIKLGTSGLIAAYREAARLALDDAVIETRYVMERIAFTFPYMAMNDVMKLVKGGEVEIASQEFDNTCRMELSVRASLREQLLKKLSDIDGVSLADT